ncbi:inverse autotransporter beta domain-containing protein [Xenorhabdus sp. Vera]|uniref:inverse autotransporter beta domain-containing protein n=1 Tax=Xenorhabdus koppenhoeferi TaxID=351659 RepID=UPI0019874FBF|nr:inverse autotransporter beta domain-containing protein [Xenorhabdus sp. Vera]MBD2811408.1 inverse autotransporter beta domain-containing protein [Xenorhabdus sp. Vera]
MTNTYAEGVLSKEEIYIKKENKIGSINRQPDKDNERRSDIKNNKVDIVEGNNNSSELNAQYIIAKNIQAAGIVLSSSPSQLTEQAASYALGKLNSTVSSEVQKWLSQFGTARINFSLDKKGKLDNGSLDLLLPLYDNKTDWLIFSQLGYRNKDSRHTLNIGLGGRYFTSNWMYGLNTFFDHDVTGRNKRLGIGGEAWSDYVKLSANTYWRLSQWHQSPKEIDYEERPANGFDLTGEFFLPAYPHFGGKLSYERYFGAQVSLFNRDTKQKNPSLARFGLNYTPIPLVTMALDYKHGSGGRSEALFQTSLNYRFGVPFSTQISSGNVASMRTLAGSRYDLVARNNNIVLDYRKKQELQITLPHSISGYSTQPKSVEVQVTSDKPIKQVTWRADEGFIQNGGELPHISKNNAIEIVLPKYIRHGINRYLVYAVAEEEDGRQSKTAEMFVIVEPFIVKGKPQDIIVDGKAVHILAATITYGQQNNAPLSNVVIPSVKWTVELPEGSSSGEKNPIELQTISDTTNDKGQLTATVSSTEIVRNALVYLEIDGMPKIKIATISFNHIQPEYSIDSMTVSPESPIALGNENDIYTFVATILGTDGQPLKNKTVNAGWRVDPENNNVKLKESDTTDDEGRLIATLSNTSQKPAEVKVGLKIGQGEETFSEPVAFVADDKQTIKIQSLVIDSSQELEATGENKFTFTAMLADEAGKPIKDSTPITPTWQIEKGVSGMKLTVESLKPNSKGELVATVTSTQEIKDAQISLSIQDDIKTLSPLFTFIPAKSVNIQLRDEIEVSPSEPIWGNGQDAYTYKVLVVDPTNGQPMRHWSFAEVEWSIKNNKLPDDLIFKDIQKTTDAEGYLTVSLVSKVGVNKVTAKIEVNKKHTKRARTKVNFKAVPQFVGLELSAQSHHINIPATEQEKPYNVHSDLAVKLIKGSSVSSGYIVGDNVKYHSSSEVVKVFSSGDIIFPAEHFTTSKGPTIVTATVTDPDTEAIYVYEYRFNPQRYVFSPEVGNDGLVKLGENSGNSICETLDSKYSWGHRASSMTDQDIGISALTETNRSLRYEYHQFPGYGLLPYPYEQNTNIKVADSNNPSHFFLYDYDKGNKIDSDPDDEGRLLCKLSD